MRWYWFALTSDDEELELLFKLDRLDEELLESVDAEDALEWLDAEETLEREEEESVDAEDAEEKLDWLLSLELLFT